MAGGFGVGRPNSYHHRQCAPPTRPSVRRCGFGECPHLETRALCVTGDDWVAGLVVGNPFFGSDLREPPATGTWSTDGWHMLCKQELLVVALSSWHPRERTVDHYFLRSIEMIDFYGAVACSVDAEWDD